MSHRAMTVRFPLLMGALALPGVAAAATGDPYGFGLGVVIGDPTGLSFAYRPGDDWTLQAAAGWSLTRERLHLNVDYLYTLVVLEPPETPQLAFPVYVGVGGRLRVDDDGGWDDDWDDDWDDEGLGIRFPIGMAMLPKQVPFDVFVEIAPAVNLIPETEGGFDGGIGARFYF